jgi:hypothetical protein
MIMKASVALKLPGGMQLMQVPMIAGASYTVRPSFEKAHLLSGSPIRKSQSSIFRACALFLV